MKKKSEKKSKIDLFSQIKSVFILKKLYDIIETKKLSIVKYNKKIQSRINVNIKNYKEYLEIYSTIEIEIILIKNKYDDFININENEKLYYHTYINDSEGEIKIKLLR